MHLSGVSYCQVYASTSRDSLLAAVLDVLQTEVGRCVFASLITGL